eukprot:1465607-Alexandrium_andersonii.AAC.1
MCIRDSSLSAHLSRCPDEPQLSARRHCHPPTSPPKYIMLRPLSLDVSPDDLIEADRVKKEESSGAPPGSPTNP